MDPFLPGVGPHRVGAARVELPTAASIELFVKNRRAPTSLLVTAAGQTGVVSDIGLFATKLVTADNQTIIMPNNAITSGTIVNFTTRGTLRGGVDVGLAYGTDIARPWR